MVSQLAGDQRGVVVEASASKNSDRRDAQDRLVRLERHQQDPEDREQEEDQHQRDQDAADDPFEWMMCGPWPTPAPCARSRSFSHCLMKMLERK